MNSYLLPFWLWSEVKWSESEELKLPKYWKWKSLLTPPINWKQRKYLSALPETLPHLELTKIRSVSRIWNKTKLSFSSYKNDKVLTFFLNYLQDCQDFFFCWHYDFLTLSLKKINFRSFKLVQIWDLWESHSHFLILTETSSSFRPDQFQKKTD